MARNIFHRVATVLPSGRKYHSRVPISNIEVLHRRCNVHPRNPFIKVSQEVREAVENLKPVVALETTIYTHGE